MNDLNLSGFVYTTIVLQGVLMFVDEWYFHKRRQLGKWERFGHPADSLFFLLPLFLAAYFQPTPMRIKLYLILAVVSCLFITKDEWVHARGCSAGEHWVHSILFMVHPLSLAGIFFLWVRKEAFWLRGLLPLLVLVVAFYQWSYWARRQDAANH